jgi:hypothetical protein
MTLYFFLIRGNLDSVVYVSYDWGQRKSWWSKHKTETKVFCIYLLRMITTVNLTISADHNRHQSPC